MQSIYWNDGDTQPKLGYNTIWWQRYHFLFQHLIQVQLRITVVNWSMFWLFCSNGELDPWSAGGVLHTVKASLPAVVIPNAAHHLDLRAKNDGDTRDVERARQAEIDFITKLL